MLPHLFKNSMELEVNTQLRTGFSTLFGGALHVLLLPDVVELSLHKRDFMGGFKVKVVHRQTIALVDVPKRNDQQAIAPQLFHEFFLHLRNCFHWLKSIPRAACLLLGFVHYRVMFRRVPALIIERHLFSCGAHPIQHLHVQQLFAVSFYPNP